MHLYSSIARLLSDKIDDAVSMFRLSFTLRYCANCLEKTFEYASLYSSTVYSIIVYGFNL